MGFLDNARELVERIHGTRSYNSSSKSDDEYRRAYKAVEGRLLEHCRQVDGEVNSTHREKVATLLNKTAKKCGG